MATDPRKLYERDFYAWTRVQVRELRRLKSLRLNAALDLDHLALEIRDLGGEQLFAIQRHTERLTEHLLKLKYSRHEQPRRQWLRTVNNARNEIERRLTTSLRRRLLTSLPKLYGHARRDAVLALEEHGEPHAGGATADDLPLQPSGSIRSGCRRPRNRDNAIYIDVVARISPDPINSSDPIPGQTTVTGQFTFTDQAGDVDLSLQIKNTSSIASTITAFAFDLPTGVVSFIFDETNGWNLASNTKSAWQWY